jgi:hypothetical protein
MDRTGCAGRVEMIGRWVGVWMDKCRFVLGLLCWDGWFGVVMGLVVLGELGREEIGLEVWIDEWGFFKL